MYTVIVSSETTPIEKTRHPVVSVDFDVFYSSDYESVVRIGWSLTGDRAIAEEVAQEAFVVAHRRWERIQRYDNPGAWVRRVAINQSLSWLRRRRVETSGLARVSRERLSEVTAPDSTAEVWRALRTLPKRQVEVLVLVVVEDRSVSDVARILRCGEPTVRTHLRRGRLKLAELLGVDEEVSNGHAK